jgi:hypothetical protein
MVGFWERMHEHKPCMLKTLWARDGTELPLPDDFDSDGIFPDEDPSDVDDLDILHEHYEDSPLSPPPDEEDDEDNEDEDMSSPHSPPPDVIVLSSDDEVEDLSDSDADLPLVLSEEESDIIIVD